MPFWLRVSRYSRSRNRLGIVRSVRPAKASWERFPAGSRRRKSGWRARGRLRFVGRRFSRSPSTVPVGAGDTGRVLGRSRRWARPHGKIDACRRTPLMQTLSLSHIEAEDPQIFAAIQDEDRRQRENLELIASENYASKAVREAMSSIMTNKYAEGYPGKRYYGGCEYVDVAETLAIDRLKALF